MRTLNDPIGFQWDTGNIGKNTRHSVTEREAEEPFFDAQKKSFPDALHSGTEERFRIIGKTKSHRLLFIAFTIRKGKIRIISARDVNKKEASLYEKTITTT